MLYWDLIDRLKGLLEPSRVVTDEEEVRRYSQDALSPSRAFAAAPLLERRADVLVRPRSTEEVAWIVRVARDFGAPVIPYGGGTGVMGGLTPLRGGIIVDLGLMNGILEVSPSNMTATMEAGVILEDLASALAERGLMLGHDPWSVPIATVGGAISTNGVGYRAAAVGPMGAQVLGLEVVMPSGGVITTRNVPKTSSGPNLNHLFIGSEGVFGIITKATLKVYRQPEERVFSTFRFQTFEDGFGAVSEMFALGLRPAVVDLADDFEGIHLYMVFEGYRELVEAQRRRSAEICVSKKGRDMGPTEAVIYWDTRYQIAEAYRDSLAESTGGDAPRPQGRSFDYLHVALPVSRVLEYRLRCEAIFKEYDVRATEFAIWTEPELFSIVLVPGTDTLPEDMPKAVDEALMLAQDMGGIMEYCHGVGVKLAHLLPREMGAGLDVVRVMKMALDPQNIMNPGKLAL